MWGAYFCMGAYKRDVAIVIKIGAYIHGCLFCVGAYYPDFTVQWQAQMQLSLWCASDRLATVESLTCRTCLDAKFAQKIQS